MNVHSFRSGVELVALGQAGLDLGAVDLVGEQRLADLLADPQGLAVGLVGAVQAAGLTVLDEHELVLARRCPSWP